MGSEMCIRDRSRTGKSNCGATSTKDVVITEETGRGERGLMRTSLDVVTAEVEVAIGVSNSGSSIKPK